ncbi:hypothetical protein OSTOST_02916 [Ostertagia ostertagi]
MHHLLLIRNAVLGASASIPFFEGPNYGLEESPSLEEVEHPIARPVNAPVLTLDGCSVRDVVLDSMRQLLEYLFEHSEDDVKSIQQVVVILNTLASCRGLNSELFVTSVLSYRTTKAILSDQIAGNRGNIEMLSEEYTLLMHKKRNVTQSGYQCKPQHIEILRMLVKIGTSTYSQGALHMLTDHKRDALVLRAGFEAQLLAMPASWHQSQYRREMRQHCIVIGAKQKEACPLNASHGIPSADVVEANAGNLVKLKEKLTRQYYELAEKLLSLATDPNLHWRHVDMAQAFLSLLVRRDIPYPEPVLRMWVRLLVHDTVKARRMATAVVASWLKLNKPKAVKREWVIPNKEPNTSVGARWPIHYGIRDDNRCMMYEEKLLPKTEEEWNKFQFCGKQHWGFYTWPEKLITYAPLGEQDAIDRHDEDLSETERFIVETFRDPEFSARLRELFAVEESKEDSFNAVNFSLFQGLFRCFNDILCGVFKEHLEVLIMSPKEEAMRNWGVCVATVCGCSESRMLKPLLDILFALVNRPTESAFAAQSRLFLLQGGLCQFEWRTIELWNKVVALLSKAAVVQQYANLRERMAISLVTASWFDLPTIYYSPSIPDSLRAPTVADASINGTGDPEVKTTSPVWPQTSTTSLDMLPGPVTLLVDEELYKQCFSLLSKLLQATYIPAAHLPCIMQVFRQAAFSDRANSKDPIIRHGGVLGLSAIVLAAPYTVPSYFLMS